MNDLAKKTIEPAVVTLPETFDRNSLGAIKIQLDEALSASGAVQLDALSLNYVDGAAVQFLYFAQAHISGLQDCPLLTNANDYLLKAIADLGMLDHISTKSVGSEVSSS